jgi:GT2 family glycosyltransferase
MYDLPDDNVMIEASRQVRVEAPVFSIFIPTWNNLPYLKLCIKGLRLNSGCVNQIIVHINEGSDGTYEWVKSQKDLSYTYSEKNIGVCYALNQCRTLAAADYLLYLNDDMYVCYDWDNELINEILSIGHDAFFISATAIEPVQTGNNCVIVENFGTDPESFREDEMGMRFADLKMNDWQGSTWPPNVVHKKNWDLIGGYSIEFSPGLYSDPDFSMKLWKAGIRLFKGVSKSRVYHFGGKSTTRMIRNAGYFMFISKWGMSARTFTKKYLRSGEPFDGVLSEPMLPLSVRVKNWFKRVQASMIKS